jgi:hypothetical protein
MDIVWKQYGTKLKIFWKSNFHTNCNFHTMDTTSYPGLPWVRGCYGYSMEIVWIYTMDLVMQSQIP